MREVAGLRSNWGGVGFSVSEVRGGGCRELVKGSGGLRIADVDGLLNFGCLARFTAASDYAMSFAVFAGL